MKFENIANAESPTIALTIFQQPNVTFHIETSHLFCSAKELAGFYMNHNTGLKWFNSPKRFNRNELTQWIK